jgi:hypothetical protein
MPFGFHWWLKTFGLSHDRLRGRRPPHAATPIASEAPAAR